MKSELADPSDPLPPPDADVAEVDGKEINEADIPGTFTHKEILVIMSGLIMGMLLAALDQTIVSTAIRTIADDLQGYSLQAWVTTAYLVTSTLATPLYGKLSDMYGRKPFFMGAITIFIVGSLMCTFATSMYQLAAFRAFQGLGAGGLMSLALTIMGDIVAPRERAKYQGYFLAVFGTSSVIGPVVGGLFAGQAQILGISGWRWVFLVNVPIGFIALAVVYKVLHLPNIHHKGVKVDIMGALTLALGITPLLIVAEQGREWGWSSLNSMSCYIVGGLGVVAFIVTEYVMKDAALIPLRMFKNTVFALGVVISIVIGAAMFGGIVLVPQYLQVVRGSSPTEAGLQMLPLVLGLMIGSVASGQMISRTGRYRIFPIVGSALVTVGLFLLHYIGADSHLYVVMLFMLLTGFGLGNLMQPLTLALQNALPPKDMGVSTAAATFFRQIGGTLGVAVFLSILFSQIAPKITDQIHEQVAQCEKSAFTTEFCASVKQHAGTGQQAIANGTDPKNLTLDEQFSLQIMQKIQHPDATGAASNAGEGILSDSSTIQKLTPALAHPLKVGFSDSMSAVFLSASAISLFAFILVLFWKEVPLRSAAGIAARTADANEGETGEPEKVTV